jgi:carbon-monoxide dehydrogenase small subunit
MLLRATEFLREHPGETDERAIREAISGVLCRCTGYQQIVEAIQSVAARS